MVHVACEKCGRAGQYRKENLIAQFGEADQAIRPFDQKRADARFKKDERVREGKKVMLQYEAEGRAVREKTARLRAIRLDKEAAEKNEGVAAGVGQPLVARKKVKHGCY